MGLIGDWFDGQARARGKTAQALVYAVAERARAPELFGPGRASDTLEGRIEVTTLFAILALRRLNRDPEDADLAQRFIDGVFRFLDMGLREAGVGDLTVPKRMKKLAGAFYGRMQAYEAGLAAGDEQALAAALRRNLSPQPEAAAFVDRLSGFVRAQAAALDAAPIAAMVSGQAWLAPPD